MSRFERSSMLRESLAELKDVDLVNGFFLVCFDNTFS
jgi:hypothetical protein